VHEHLSFSLKYTFFAGSNMRQSALNLLPNFRAACLCVTLMWAVTIGLCAQKPVFEASADAKEVVQGNMFEVTFTLRDAPAQGILSKAPDFKGFKVLSGPHTMSGMTIVNGVSTSRQSWTYQLEALSPGAIAIGPALVRFKDQSLQSQVLMVRVVPSRQSKGSTDAAAFAGEDVFLLAETDRKETYPGGQITWRILLYTKVNVEGADLISLPDFKGFYAKERERFDTRTQTEVLKGKKYAVKVLHESALFPQETGDLVIEPAKIRVGIEQGGVWGALMPRPVLLQSPAVTVQVKPLPAPAPEHFSGGVGQYSWEVQYDKDSLSTDESMTLRITLRGNGDARRLAMPFLAPVDGLEIFEPKIQEEDEYENGSEIVYTKTIEWAVLPKKPGAYTLNPTLLFFDPDSNQYRRLNADAPVQIKVYAGANYVAEENQKNISESPVDVAEKSHFFEKITSWAWLLLLPLLLVAFFGWRLQKISSGSFCKRNASGAAGASDRGPADSQRAPVSGRKNAPWTGAAFLHGLVQSLSGVFDGAFATATGTDDSGSSCTTFATVGV
jgi:hypothetical protein